MVARAINAMAALARQGLLEKVSLFEMLRENIFQLLINIYTLTFHLEGFRVKPFFVIFGLSTARGNRSERSFLVRSDVCQY